jgi:hypothetical protein
MLQRDAVKAQKSAERFFDALREVFVGAMRFVHRWFVQRPPCIVRSE